MFGPLYVEYCDTAENGVITHPQAWRICTDDGDYSCAYAAFPFSRQQDAETALAALVQHGVLTGDDFDQMRESDLMGLKKIMYESLAW